jgi:hypothetical protein
VDDDTTKAEPKARARKGEGTVFMTKDGRHRASVTVRDLVTGKPRRVWFSGRTPGEVIPSWHGWARRQAFGRLPLPLPSLRMDEFAGRSEAALLARDHRAGIGGVGLPRSAVRASRARASAS